MNVTAEVIEEVSRYADVRELRRPGLWFIDALRGEVLDPPARLVMNERNAEDHVRRAGEESGEAVFPGFGVEQAGLAFLLLHLEEHFTTKVGSGTTVTVQADRIVVDEPKPFDIGPLPPGKYAWTGAPVGNRHPRRKR